MTDDELEEALRHAAAEQRRSTEEKLRLMELARQRSWTYERIAALVGLQRQAVYQLLNRLRRRRARYSLQNREA